METIVEHKKNQIQIRMQIKIYDWMALAMFLTCFTIPTAKQNMVCQANIYQLLHKFVDRMLFLAIQFCILMWFVGQAGVIAATPYGKKVDCNSGRYQRFVQTIMSVYS